MHRYEEITDMQVDGGYLVRVQRSDPDHPAGLLWAHRLNMTCTTTAQITSARLPAYTLPDL